jgi:hypothetical protein
VENEDRLVSWKQIVAFFSALATDGDLGGSDGFLRVPPNYANRKLLETFSTKNAPHSSRPDLPEQVLVAADTCEFEELTDIFCSSKGLNLVWSENWKCFETGLARRGS